MFAAKSIGMLHTQYLPHPLVSMAYIRPVRLARFNIPPDLNLTDAGRGNTLAILERHYIRRQANYSG